MAGDRSFKKLRTDDRVLDSVQDHVETSISPLLKKDFLYGNIIEDINLVSTGETIVNHGLGKNWTGFIVIKKSANSVVWNKGIIDTTFPDRNIILNCSADVTVSLYIF